MRSLGGTPIVSTNCTQTDSAMLVLPLLCSILAFPIWEVRLPLYQLKRCLPRCPRSCTVIQYMTLPWCNIHFAWFRQHVWGYGLAGLEFLNVEGQLIRFGLFVLTKLEVEYEVVPSIYSRRLKILRLSAFMPNFILIQHLQVTRVRFQLTKFCENLFRGIFLGCFSNRWVLKYICL